jgi:putative transposase
VTVSGKGSGRVSVAGLICVRPGQRTRLIYRTITYRGRKNEKKGFGIGDLQTLLTAAHNQLRAPIVLVWDNLSAHVGPTMRKFIDERDWLTVFRLPGYAPELNPTEGIWANLKGRLRNLAVRGIDQLTTIIKTHLKRMQYRPGLLDAIITQTGLTLAQPP